MEVWLGAIDVVAGHVGVVILAPCQLDRRVGAELGGVDIVARQRLARCAVGRNNVIVVAISRQRARSVCERGLAHGGGCIITQDVFRRDQLPRRPDTVAGRYVAHCANALAYSSELMAALKSVSKSLWLNVMPTALSGYATLALLGDTIVNGYPLVSTVVESTSRPAVSV